MNSASCRQPIRSTPTSSIERRKFRHPPHVQGLSNGVRELMLLPAGDLSRAFQHRSSLTGPDFYHLFDDIVLYAMDTSGLERKGNTYIVQDNPAVPISRTIKLARLQYAGNWDPEPGGWRRLAAVLHNNDKVALAVATVKLGDGSLITPPRRRRRPRRPSETEIRQMAVKRIPPADLVAAMAADPLKAACTDQGEDGGGEGGTGRRRRGADGGQRRISTSPTSREPAR